MYGRGKVQGTRKVSWQSQRWFAAHDGENLRQIEAARQAGTPEVQAIAERGQALVTAQPRRMVRR